MNIKRMTATFGTLEKAELVLTPGLNVITAPNEFGKSTWAAFLLAMLYGVDTAERASKTNLPAKVKYKPWSGQAMEGRLELEFQGRNLTLERTSQGRGSFNAFRAFDTDTGQTLDWLREDTCGQTLLGVPRGVWERSGFIRQQGLALSGDPALEARLTALVTTGDETVSYSQTEKRLRDLRNRRRHNRTGLLPQAEAEWQEVRDALDAMASLGRENRTQQASLDALTAEQAALRQTLARLQAAEMAQKRRQLDESHADWEKKARFLADKQRTVAGLPTLEALQSLVRQWDTALEQRTALDAALRLGVALPQAPPRLPVFAGLDPDAIRQRAEDDCRRLAALASVPQPRPLFWILAAVLAVCGAALLLFLPIWGGVLLAAAALAGVSALAARQSHRRRCAANARERAGILAPYQAQDEAGLRRAANDCREAALLYAQTLLTAQQQQQALDQRQTAAAQREDALLAQTRAFAPDVQAPSAARAAAQQAVYRRQFQVAAAREEAQARAQYEAVREAVGALEPAPEEVVALTPAPDAGQLSARLESVTEALLRVRSQLDQQRGRMLALGDPAALAARQELLEGRIAQLQREYDALGLALDALVKANDTLQTRFSPRLGELAAGNMARLTAGRYDKVLLTQDMSVHARQTGDVVGHPLLALSAGTADQLYLAIRLAIAALALDAQTPLVLDDALAFFDDTRMAAAVALLAEHAKTRQVLLFTCQSREAACAPSFTGGNE